MAGCNSCSTTSGTGGCQNNGTCGTSDCNKMNSYDWLSHMGIPEIDRFDIVEVKFKGGRKEYYRNTNQLHLTTGDPIVVDVPNGHHIGYVSLQGELVRLQMQKRKVKDNDDILKIYRVANQKDLEKWSEAKNREIPTLYRAKQIIDELGMQMKLSDVEYQADNSKATFYYSADDRVDFRELIKLLAGEFRIRIEMRQISLRQEAGRIGGVGVCGRELCCSTWIHDFKSVSTSAARYQNLSLNPSRLSGQCGRLKCCLKYEDEMYRELLKGLPKVGATVMTPQGPGRVIEVLTLKESVLVDLGEGRRVVVRARDLDRAPEDGQPAAALREAAPLDVEDGELPSETASWRPEEEVETGEPAAATLVLVDEEAGEEAEAAETEAGAAPQAPPRPPRRRSRRSRGARARKGKGGDGSPPAPEGPGSPEGAARHSPAPEGSAASSDNGPAV